jgi:hypothetical protein
MKLIDQVTLAEIQLPNDLLWEDEFKWSPKASTPSWALSGSLIVEHGIRLAGRPITLTPPDNEMAWVSRNTHELLRAAAAIPARRFKLMLEYPTDTRQFLVAFAPVDEAISGNPVKGFPEHEANAWFSLTLKFIEVNE